MRTIKYDVVTYFCDAGMEQMPMSSANTPPTDGFRTEQDSMGSLQIPNWAYWGAQTQRAVENFRASPLKINTQMLRALAIIKKSMAVANRELKTLDAKIADAIVRAADEIILNQDDRWTKHFPIDVFQTGSGTSWNMNINEVISNRANQLLGSPLGTRSPVHPNDHVNRGQSSNDVIPTALNIANALTVIEQVPHIRVLCTALYKKAEQYADAIKLGRTHLQDAVPMTFGNLFSGYGAQIEEAAHRIEEVLKELAQLPLGGTAVGTGLNAHPKAAAIAIEHITNECGFGFVPARNRFALMAGRDAQVALSGSLNVLATALMKIANDIRLLASGPRAGFAELTLPALQPGSSIMPGKINPVIPEMVIQVAAKLCGSHTTVTIAAQHAPLELNMMHPLIAYETISSVELAGKCCKLFAETCIADMTVNEEHSRALIEHSLALVTPLALEIGYDTAAEIAHTAYKSGKSIKAVAMEMKVLDEQRLDELLDPRSMLGNRTTS